MITPVLKQVKLELITFLWILANTIIDFECSSKITKCDKRQLGRTNIIEYIIKRDIVENGKKNFKDLISMIH